MILFEKIIPYSTEAKFTPWIISSTVFPRFVDNLHHLFIDITEDSFGIRKPLVKLIYHGMELLF